MDKGEAKALLREHLDEWRQRSYAELTDQVGKPQYHQPLSPSGTRYGIQVEVLWEREPGGSVRVCGAIDDASLWRRMCPLIQDFVMAPDGSVAGEEDGE